ncbi:MAG: DNA adenine methylase, partial [Eubacteriales bacterium]
PYFETEDYYEDVGFTKDDHIRLADRLSSIEGKYLLSYNDCPEIRELYKSRGTRIESISRLSNIAQRYEAGKQYDELIISNYDTQENRDSIRQLSFADMIDDT